MKGYNNIAKYYGKRMQKWKPVAEAYSAASTAIRVQVGGFAAGIIVGRLTVTYYIAFKGPKTIV